MASLMRLRLTGWRFVLHIAGRFEDEPEAKNRRRLAADERGKTRIKIRMRLISKRFPNVMPIFAPLFVLHPRESASIRA